MHKYPNYHDVTFLGVCTKQTNKQTCFITRAPLQHLIYNGVIDSHFIQFPAIKDLQLLRFGSYSDEWSSPRQPFHG